ncbi:MAG: hypothetical protein EA371_13770 [Gammaproteobacteria bacterium]|nr:MAG: hypothetical protein EA371_13770 [Gammaproteobacteria bacterium]
MPLAACGGPQDEEARRHELMARADLVPSDHENAAGQTDNAATEATSEEGGDSEVVFAPEVHTLLVARCQGCHDGGRNPDSGFPVHGDAAQDFETARAMVDTDDPAASPLLAVSVGEGHPAGPVFDRDSDDYATLLAWAEAGARFDEGRAAP